MKNPQPSYAPPTLDEEVRNRILMEQMPQVRYIARHIHDRLPQHVPMEDLVHAGVLGLMDALTKYDEARQVQFKTYAKFRIRGAILDSLRELDWSPRDLRRKARLIEIDFGPPQPRTGTLGHRAGDRRRTRPRASMPSSTCSASWRASISAASTSRAAIRTTTTISASTCPAIPRRVLTFSP